MGRSPSSFGDTPPPNPPPKAKPGSGHARNVGLLGKLKSPKIPLTFNYVFLTDLFPDIRRSEPYIGFMII